MLADSKAYSGFAVDDLEQGREFYEGTLGLRVSAEPDIARPKPQQHLSRRAKGRGPGERRNSLLRFPEVIVGGAEPHPCGSVLRGGT